VDDRGNPTENSRASGPLQSREEGAAKEAIVFEKVCVKFIIRKTADMWKKNNQFGFLPGWSTMDAAI
jgi:hypothetical protein